jgi:hypothetical protein
MAVIEAFWNLFRRKWGKWFLILRNMAGKWGVLKGQ